MELLNLSSIFTFALQLVNKTGCNLDFSASLCVLERFQPIGRKPILSSFPLPVFRHFIPASAPPEKCEGLTGTFTVFDY